MIVRKVIVTSMKNIVAFIVGFGTCIAYGMEHKGIEASIHRELRIKSEVALPIEVRMVQKFEAIAYINSKRAAFVGGGGSKWQILPPGECVITTYRTQYVKKASSHDPVWFSYEGYLQFLLRSNKLYMRYKNFFSDDMMLREIDINEDDHDITVCMEAADGEFRVACCTPRGAELVLW
jgi:hypothetical protein